MTISVFNHGSWTSISNSERRFTFEIKERRETAFDIDYVDAAHGYDASGNLKWLGRVKNWTLNRAFQEARAVFKSGIDADGDYIVSKEGQPGHWVLTDTDTGEIIEPA